MNIKKIETTIWGIITCLMFVITIMHPRMIYLIILFIGVILGFACYKSKKEKTVGKMCKDLIGNLIVLWFFYAFFGQYFNIVYPYRAPYEYKKDMASFKADSLQEYYFFPDRIPKGSSGVKWMCVPNLMQGIGYEKLFFYADDSYLQEICNTYKEKATVYKYIEYAWTNSDTGKFTTFPGDSSIDSDEREDIEVFMLYDNQDANHLHNGGFYINQKEGYICFFSQ